MYNSIKLDIIPLCVLYKRKPCNIMYIHTYICHGPVNMGWINGEKSRGSLHGLVEASSVVVKGTQEVQSVWISFGLDRST